MTRECAETERPPPAGNRESTEQGPLEGRSWHAEAHQDKAARVGVQEAGSGSCLTAITFSVKVMVKLSAKSEGQESQPGSEKGSVAPSGRQEEPELPGSKSKRKT